MMSEKRFILKKTTAITSNYPQGERVYDTILERELYYPEIVDVMNILDEVVESLKRENSDLHMEIQRLVSVILMSEERFTLNTDDKGVILIPNSILRDGKEMSEREVVDCLNEQQEQIEQLNLAIDDLLSHTSCDEIKKENEQLKEELQRFKKYVFSQDNILCYKCEHCIKKDIYVVDCEMKGEVDVHGLCSLFREVKV